MTAGADGDRHRQQGAQVEVLQRVDVVDGPGQEVAAAPARQAGRHPRRQAVVEPDPPPGQGPQRGVVADQAFGVAQRAAQEGEHLDRGQDADDGAEARAQRGPADDVARPGQQADGGRGRGQAEQPGAGPAGRRACPARPGRGAASRGGGSRRHQPAGRGRREGDDGSNRAAGRARGRPPRRSGPRATDRCAGARRATVGGSSDGGGLVEQQDRGRAQQGPGQRHPLAFAGAQRQAVVADHGRQARRAGWPRGRTGRRHRARRSRSSSVASGAPSRRLSASVALKRCGRWGSQEKWARHCGQVVSAARARAADRHGPGVGLDEAAAVRRARSTCPTPDGPVSATRAPGGRGTRRTTSGGTVAVRVVDRAALRRQSAAVLRRPRPRAVDRPDAAVGAGAGVASTSSTRSAAACPSVLAWNSAPARRSGMKISGATSSTAIAV